MQKLEDMGESMETITTWHELQVPEQADLDFDLLPLGIDLRKLLIQVTGQSDIENITAVKLKVHTIQAGLHRLAEFTPTLRVLTLDDSCVDSLRDLGASLKSLEKLSVSRCGLKSLDGIWGFRNLKVFLARDNMITDISQCSSVDKLAILDVANNEINDLSSFAFLQNCKRLRNLYVAGNRFDNYKDVMIGLLPQIRILDEEEIRGSGKFVGRPQTLESDSEPSKDKSPNLISVESVHGVSLMAFGKKGEEDLSPENDGDLESQREARKLDAGDEKYIVSRLNHNYTENVQEKYQETQGIEKNMIASSSSTFSMAPKFHEMSMSDLPSNIGKYRHNRETTPGKLSSGPAICGNLAASLRSRNLSKNPFTLSASWTNFTSNSNHLL